MTDSGSEMMPAMRHVQRNLNEENVVKLKLHRHIRYVCHIQNRALKGCETILKTVIDKIQTGLRNIRISVPLREAFREIQMLSGRKTTTIVLIFDVETRQNSVFKKIESCFSLEDVFQAM